LAVYSKALINQPISYKGNMASHAFTYHHIRRYFDTKKSRTAYTARL